MATFSQKLRQLRSTARLKMRCFAVWSVMLVTVILVVGAEAAGVPHAVLMRYLQMQNFNRRTERG